MNISKSSNDGWLTLNFVISQMTFYRGKIYATSLKQITSQRTSFPFGSIGEKGLRRNLYGNVYLNVFKYFINSFEKT